MNVTKESLKEARKIIQNGWTRGAYAKNAAGTEVEFDSPTACSFCSMGACLKADEGNANWLMEELSRALTVLHPRYIPRGVGWQFGDKEGPVIVWNDEPNRTKEEVIELFDKAIELAGEYDD